MRVCIFGLGYVGCVTAACLAREGHTVTGIEINPEKLDILRAGHAPVIEPGLDELIAAGIGSGALRVTNENQGPVEESEAILVCIQTPSNGNGSLNTTFLEGVFRQIGVGIARKGEGPVVILRSTVLPGTLEKRLIPILEETSGLCAARDFGVCMNPEFLREGSAIRDFEHPSFIIIGETDLRSGDAAQELYQGMNAPIVRTSLQNAEMLKYVCNTFHAVKVAFANEIGSFCKAHGLDGQQIMELFCQDDQLNISPAYLRPGFAFGGSCLPKDLRALVYRAKQLDLEFPLLSHVWDSNQQQIQRGLEMIEQWGRTRVGILGLSFKAGTDDVRESPMVQIIETLIGKGYQVTVYDESVRLARLMGANKTFLEQQLPHIASLMRPAIGDVVGESEIIVIGNANPAFREVPQMIHTDQLLIDLVGIARRDGETRGAYEGICW